MCGLPVERVPVPQCPVFPEPLADDGDCLIYRNIGEEGGDIKLTRISLPTEHILGFNRQIIPILVPSD